MSKEQKQKNFFKTIYTLSEREQEKELLGGEKYKLIKIRLPIDVIEELKEWSEEE